MLVLLAGSAFAGGRKRIVVLEFEGPKAERFHGEIVRLLKKSHTVVSADKWNGTADELDATRVTDKNVKKVAKKLKVDGVVTGRIEKRRDEYIIQLRLRAGKTGALVGGRIDTKSEDSRIEGDAQRDLKDELIGAIDELESNHGGGSGDDDDDDADASSKRRSGDEDDDGEARPSKKKSGDDEAEGSSKRSGFAKKSLMDDDEDARPKKKAKDDEDRPAKKKGKDDDEGLSTRHDEDENPLPAKKKKASDDADADGDGDEDEDGGSRKRAKKKVASEDEGEDGDAEVDAEGEVGGMEAAEAVSPSQRAVDAVFGLSFIARRLSFSSAADLAQPPPAYKQAIPVAGAMFNATLYPMAIGHKRQGIISGLGLTVLYDRVLKISSQKKYMDNAGNTQTATLQTVEDRYAFGAAFRYGLGHGAMAPVIGAKLQYGRQQFGVSQQLPNGEATDIPNVHYTIIEPSVFFQYPAAPKITLNAEVGFLAITDTGSIQKPCAMTTCMAGEARYGAATVNGFEGNVGLDYALTRNLFARGGIRLERIGFKFKGDPASETNQRDTDPDQDVFGATDLYFGAVATIGYLY